MNLKVKRFIPRKQTKNKGPSKLDKTQLTYRRRPSILHVIIN